MLLFRFGSSKLTNKYLSCESTQVLFRTEKIAEAVIGNRPYGANRQQDMKTLIKVLGLMLLIIFVTGCYRNPVERNSIVFADKNANVEKALTQMTGLILMLPKTELNTNYSLENDGLYINNSYVGTITSTHLDTVKALGNFSMKQKIEFLTLTKFLKRNFISAGYVDESIDVVAFTYRELPSEDYHDTRFLTICSVSDITALMRKNRILDHKNSIFLLAGRDAKIR